MASTSVGMKAVRPPFHVMSPICCAPIQAALQTAHVDSITCFAKCHHGWSYYDTAVGKRHPQLTQELLPLQIEACHELGIKVPIYISAGFDQAALQAHPEWGCKDREGRTFTPLNPGYGLLCFNSPYLDYLCNQIEEIVDQFAGDGLFLDIIWAHPCYCAYCMRTMLSRRVDPTDDAQAMEFAREVLITYYNRSNQIARKHDRSLRVFHNTGFLWPGMREVIASNSHLEVDLPLGNYDDHFPLSARYATALGVELVGMTGKFHTCWGEFGGFKREAALQRGGGKPGEVGATGARTGRTGLFVRRG